MLTKDLINNCIPQLQPDDSVAKALQLMNDFRVPHLPVVDESMLLGLVSEDDLLDVQDEKTLLGTLNNIFIQATTKSTDFFLAAVKSCIEYDCRLVAVLNEKGEYEGAISSWDLLKTLGDFVGVERGGGIIVLSIERVNYSISEISRIVEGCDATILHLNTQSHPDTDVMTVTINVNKDEISSIISTFERYEYTVIFNYGHEVHISEIETNYKHLMNYLNI